MLDQILWLDVLLKLSCGIPLVLVPLASFKAAGLPAAGSMLAVRMLGAAMIGIASAIMLEGMVHRTTGLGPGGAFLVNLTGALVLGLVLVSGKTELVLRARLLLWLLFAAMGLLAALELPFS